MNFNYLKQTSCSGHKLVSIHEKKEPKNVYEFDLGYA